MPGLVRLPTRRARFASWPTSPQGGEASWLSRVALQQLGEGAFELGEALVHLNHLVGADGVVWVDIGLVLGPLSAAVTAVEQVAVGVGAVNVDRRVLGSASTGAFALVWFQL